MFILAACFFFIVQYRKKQKEPFVANMDDVMNYYCEETQPGKDDYKGPWDRVARPYCVTSTCPSEDCWTLEPKNFGLGRGSYYWKYENAPEMRSNAGTESNVSNVCITKHNTPNSNARRCGTKPDTGRCEQNIFNPTPDRKCCTWNNQEKRWGCSMYNYFLNSNNVCQFREVYGDNVMNESDCTDQFPICSSDTKRCPDNSVIRETYNSNGECVWGTCESCSKENINTCWTFDSATRMWNGKRYKRFFGIPYEGSITRKCDWYHVNEIGEQITYLTRPDPCDSKPSENIPNKEEVCYDLGTTKTADDAYLQDTIRYQAGWDVTGSNIVWTTSNVGYDDIPQSNSDTYFNTSNSNCYPSCPIGTSLTNNYQGSGSFTDSLGRRACVPCESNYYYTGSNCDDIEDDYNCCQELAGCSNVFEKMVVTKTTTPKNDKYINSDNTCSNCGPNGFTVSKYDKECRYCDTEKNYYNSNNNRCSVCSNSNQYIEIKSNWRVCTTCPTTNNSNGAVYYHESESNCKFQCVQGYQGGGPYSNDTYPACVEIAKCGVNQKKNFESNSCEPCSPGYENPYFNHEMSNCTICPKDTYSSESGCTYCPVHRVTRTHSYPGKTLNPGASNVNQCYLPCTTDSKIYYSNDKYDVDLCGKSKCPGPLDYWGSNITAPSNNPIAFDSIKRIEKTYSKWNHEYGNGMCQSDSKPSGLTTWDNCGGHSLLNNEYCCGPYSNTKKLNSSNNYCECQPAPHPHSNKYRAADGKCVIQCASVPDDSNFTYASKADLTDCYKVCKSNYYLSNNQCESCPDGGYSDPGSTTIRSCYKTKDTHGDDSRNRICKIQSKKIDGNIGNRRVMYLTSNYDQQYCKNTCPGGFQSVSPNSRYTNMNKYVYRGPTEVYGACPHYDEIDYSNNLYKIDLTSTGTASNSLATFNSNEDYYLCEDEVQFTRRSGNNYASCCLSNQTYDFRNDKCEDMHVRYVRTNFFEQGKHTNTNVYERQLQMGPAPPTQFIDDILPDNRHGTNGWPVYRKSSSATSGNKYEYSAIPEESNLSSLTEDKLLYRCMNRTDRINLFEDSGEFHCCPSNLPYIEPGGVCTVSCGNATNSITYNGECYVEAKLKEGEYVLGKGDDYVGKYSDVYGLGIGDQNNLPQQNCTLQIKIQSDENEILVQPWTDPTTSPFKKLGLSVGMLVEAGTGYPTLYVKLSTSSPDSSPEAGVTSLSEFMFIISSQQDHNWGDRNNKIYYSHLVNFNGIRYLRFTEFPRYGDQLNTNIPRNAEVPFFTSQDLANYASENASNCPLDRRSDRTIDGADRLDGLVSSPSSNMMYLWDPSYECRLECANATDEFGKAIMVHFNAGAGSYDSCPPQPYPAAWNTSMTNDRQIECTFEPGGTVFDYENPPQRSCAIDSNSNSNSAFQTDTNTKVLCLNDTVWSPSPTGDMCQYVQTYYDFDVSRERTYDSVNGDSNEIKYRMTEKPKKKYTWVGTDSNTAPLAGSNNNTIYECSISSGPSTSPTYQVSNYTPPICCANATDNITSSGGKYYCCPSSEIYIPGIGCLPTTCADGIFIKDTCFKPATTLTGTHFPVKYENSNLLLNNNTVQSSVIDYNSVVQVTNTGRLFWNGSTNTTFRPGTFSNDVSGFYSNESNKTILKFKNGNSEYFIDNTGQKHRIINNYVDANESNFYLKLDSMSNCPAIHNNNKLFNRNQQYVSSSNECIYHCPTDCGSNATYSNNNIDSCPLKQCSSNDLRSDGIQVSSPYKVPCSSDCCSVIESYVSVPVPVTNWSPSNVVSGPLAITCSTGTLKKVKPTSTSDLKYAPFYYCASNNKIYDITCPSPAARLNDKYCYDEGLSNDTDIDGPCMYDSNSSNEFDSNIGNLYLCESTPTRPVGANSEPEEPTTNWPSSSIDNSPEYISCSTGTLKKVKPTSISGSNYAPFYYCESNSNIYDIEQCTSGQVLHNKYCYDEGLSNDVNIDEPCMYDSNRSNDYGEPIGYLYLCEVPSAATPAGGDGTAHTAGDTDTGTGHTPDDSRAGGAAVPVGWINMSQYTNKTVTFDVPTTDGCKIGNLTKDETNHTAPKYYCSSNINGSNYAIPDALSNCTHSNIDAEYYTMNTFCWPKQCSLCHAISYPGTTHKNEGLFYRCTYCED